MESCSDQKWFTGTNSSSPTRCIFSPCNLSLSDQHAAVGRDYVNKNVHFVRASERDNRMDILRTAAARLTAIMMRCRRRCQPIGIHAHIYTLTELLLYCMSVKTNCAGWRNTHRQTVQLRRWRFVQPTMIHLLKL